MGLTTKQQRFIEEYTVDWNATQAAIRAGYSEKTAHHIGSENLRKPDIKEAIEARIKEKTLTADQLLQMQSELAQLDLSPYIETAGKATWLNAQKMIDDGLGKHIKVIKYTPQGGVLFEFYDKQRAQEKLLGALTPQIGDPERPQTIKIVYDDDNA